MLRRPAPSLDILVVVLVTVGIVNPVAVAVALITVEFRQTATSSRRHCYYCIRTSSLEYKWSWSWGGRSSTVGVRPGVVAAVGEAGSGVFPGR
jgi:hypothetical protein